MSNKDDDKEFKVEFAPGCLEQLEAELSPEELQEFMDKIASAIADGSFFADAVEVNMDELAEQDPELYEKLQELDDGADFTNNKPTLH